MHYAWVIAFTGTLVLLLAQGFGRLSYSVILPPMKQGLQLTYTEVGLIGTGNFVGYLLLALIGGFLAVRFGPRRTVFASVLCLGVAMCLTGLADSFINAFLMRLVAGMGNGGAVSPMMGLFAAWFSARKRGLAAGIATIGTGIGLSVVGLVLPRFMAGFGADGWRYAWFLLGIVVVVCSFVCFGLLRDDPSEKGTSMHGGEEARKGPSQVTFFSAWSDVLREKEVWKLGLVYSMFGFSYIIYITFFVAYLTAEQGLVPRQAGEMFAVLGLCSIASGVIWGWISDVVGRRYGCLLASVTLAMSYLIFAYWKTLPGFYVSSIVFGFTLSAIPTIMAAAVGDSMGGKLAPAAMGFATLIFGIGQSLGPAFAGWMKDATGTFTSGFVLSAGVSLLGAVTSLLLKKKA